MGTVDQEELLERIAAALEEINSNLSEINLSLDNFDQNFESCISRIGSNNLLCITGNVTTY